MTVIPENIFNTQVGEDFLVNLFKPSLQPYLDTLNLSPREEINKVKEIMGPKMIEMYTENAKKLNKRFTNLKDSITNLVTAAPIAISACAVPTCIPAGVSSVLGIISQIKNLGNSVDEVKEVLKEMNMSDPSVLDSLVPGAGSIINGVIETIEAVTNTLESFPLPI